ncbi:hypothetical protein H696_04712 [Fonticula alba]|uniref:Ergosterol biosynthetic protein 28 n=1 Tax=Fonticula alba TaxID=691883 RepID=A0A058Z3C1_FONAL|nr:hypothetical protein H696_04712 [Fonticula alba]KCV68418.1 hypothetical protein H696_04712 [Fonticula alba]|eukprot:XP_009496850.1 hypothetical protein H696_04712 [Fonticula alba]
MFSVMPSLATLARASLIYAAIGRVVGAYLGFCRPDQLRKYLYTIGAVEVTPLAGRIFTMWVTLTGVLCVVAAHQFHVQAFRLTAIASFGLAFSHFMSEVFIFRTLRFKDTYSTMAVALTCTVLLTLNELMGM